MLWCGLAVVRAEKEMFERRGALFHLIFHPTQPRLSLEADRLLLVPIQGVSS